MATNINEMITNSRVGLLGAQHWALVGLTGPAAVGALRSDGGIMSGVRLCGGSVPWLTFCWIRYMARENCSRLSLPICLVSARPLGRVAEDLLAPLNT